MAGAALIEISDLIPFIEGDVNEDKLSAMIEDAMALAVKAAPCMASDDFVYGAAAKAVLRGAILRWNDSGSGAMSAHTMAAGTYSESSTFDTRQVRRTLFWPSELEELQSLCGETRKSAFSIDLVPDGAMERFRSDGYC